MDTLCSDKTGTLTQNIMTIEPKLPWCARVVAAALTTSESVFEYAGYKPNNVWSCLKSTYTEIRDGGSAFSVLFNSRGAAHDRLVKCCTHVLTGTLHQT